MSNTPKCCPNCSTDVIPGWDICEHCRKPIGAELRIPAPQKKTEDKSTGAKQTIGTMGGPAVAIIGLFLFVLIVTSIIPPGEFINPRLEENLWAPFIFLGPSALIIYLLKKRVAGWSIILIAVTVIFGMTSIGATLGHRYGPFSGYAPSQQGAGEVISCVVSGCFAAFFVAPIGLLIRAAKIRK